MQRSIDKHADHSRSQFVYLQEQIAYLLDRFRDMDPDESQLWPFRSKEESSFRLRGSTDWGGVEIFLELVSLFKLLVL